MAEVPVKIRAAQEEVDRLFEDYVALLGELVRCPSPLGDVRSAQEVVFRQLRQIGLEAHIANLEPEMITPHQNFSPVDWNWTGQPNVWGVLPATTSGGKSLVLNGHIDIVPAGPIEHWTYDPWGAEVSGGRMYGRGALDMKSGLVAGMLALHAVRAAGIELGGRVVFESVIEEECAGNGMLAQRQWTGDSDGAIILEPTGNATWIATPGVLWFEATIEGKAAYVGEGGAYVNAIETAAALIQRLKSPMVEELNASFNHPAFADLPNPLTVSVGTIEGGGWPSSVPLACQFICRMSYPIGWSFAEARRFVERHITRAASEDLWLAEHPPVVRFPGFRASGWEYAADPALLRLIEKQHCHETGTALTKKGWPGTADGRYFAASDPVVYYGPTGGNIHAPDEYVEVETMRQVARVVAGVISNWCAP